MKKIIILIFLTLGINCLVYGQSNADSLRAEAKKFSLEIVKSYFQGNCETHYNIISDSVIILDGDGIVEKKNFKDKLCESFNSAVRNKSKKYKNYLDDYIIEIYTPQELLDKKGAKLPDYYVPTETDYFFFGYKQKDETKEDFIWDDMFIFMVRKENNRWIFKGASG